MEYKNKNYDTYLMRLVTSRFVQAKVDISLEFIDICPLLTFCAMNKIIFVRGLRDVLTNNTDDKIQLNYKT